MTDKSFNDIQLKALNIGINLRNIAKHHPDAEWEDYPGDIASCTWPIADLIARVDAIHSVLGFIAETPNGYINREALDGLWEQLKVPMEFLESDWAQQALAEATRKWLDGEPGTQRAVFALV